MWFAPAYQQGLSDGGLTGAATAFVVPLALCQSPVRKDLINQGFVDGCLADGLHDYS